MILGHVRDYLPRVSLTLPGIRGPLSVEFVADTGFEGDLSVPSALLSRLDASFFKERHLQLADGSIITRLAYFIDIDWGGEVRPTEVMVLENAPLLGAILMNESHLDADMRAGGEVVIEPD